MAEKRKHPEKFKYLRHTADAKFQAFGKTLDLAFGNAALALASLMWDPAEILPAAGVEVAKSGKDLKQLLLAFLEELLFLLETRNFLLHSVEKISIRKTARGYILKAVFRGDVEAADTEIFGSVKAVTYHDMQIRAGDRPMVQVVVDM